MRGSFPLATVAGPCLCALVAGCGAESYPGPVDGHRALHHCQKIVEFGPRPAGGKNLTAVAAYIQQQLRDLELKPQQEQWQETLRWRGQEHQVAFQNLWVEIPGKAGAEPRPIVVVGAHYDSKLCEGHAVAEQNFHFVGAIDSAGACGLLLELARHLKARNEAPVDYWLVWFDGEESLDFDWNKELSLFGSKRFVKTMGADRQRFPKGLSARMRAMVLFDLVGSKNPKIDRDTASDDKLIKIFEKAAATLGVKHRVFQYESSFTDDHLPFLNCGIPSIDLIDLTHRVPAHLQKGKPVVHPDYETWWHSKDDTLDKMSPDSLTFAGNLFWTALPEVEAFAQRQ
jgi:Zn-dependent M28 family amino/carboxypeptidase